MDRAVWQTTVYGVAWSWTWLGDYIAAAGKAETKAEHSRTIVQQQSRVLVPPQRTLTIPLSFSAGTKASTQVEDDDFMLSTRFLELHPVTLPPTNQKKVCIEWRIMKTPSPNDSLLKNFSLEIISNDFKDHSESPVNILLFSVYYLLSFYPYAYTSGFFLLSIQFILHIYWVPNSVESTMVKRWDGTQVARADQDQTHWSFWVNSRNNLVLTHWENLGTYGVRSS